MVCRECGAYNAEHLSHCRVCAARLKDGPDTAAADTAVAEEGRPAKDFVRAPSWPQRAYSGAPEAPVYIPPDDEAEDLPDTEDDAVPFDGGWKKPASAPSERASVSPAAKATAAKPAPAAAPARTAAKPAAGRTCSVCGKPLLPEAPFCAYCGAHVGLSDEETFTTTTASRTASPNHATARPAAAPARRAAAPAYDEEEDEEDILPVEKPAKAKKGVFSRKKAQDDDEYEDDAYDDDEYADDDDEEEDDDDMPGKKSKGTTILFWALILLLVALIAVFGMYIVRKNYGGDINNLISSVFGGKQQTDPQTGTDDNQAGGADVGSSLLLGTGTIEEGVSDTGLPIFLINVYAPTGSTLKINTTTELDKGGTVTIPSNDHMIIQVSQSAFLPNAPLDASVMTIAPDILVTTPAGESYTLKIDPITMPAQALTLNVTEPLTDTVNANFDGSPITVSGTVDDHTVSVFVGGEQTTVYADEQGNGVFTATYQPKGGTEPETLLVEAKKNNCMTATTSITIEPYVVQNMALVISNDVAGLTASNGQVTISGTVTPGAAVTASCASSNVTCGTVAASETGNFSFTASVNAAGAYEVKVDAKLEGYNDATASCFVERYPDGSSSSFKKAAKGLAAESHAQIVAGTLASGDFSFTGKISEIVGTTPYTVFKATLSTGEEVVLCNRSTKNTIGTDDVKKSKTFAGTLVGTYGDTGLPYIWCWYIWNK